MEGDERCRDIPDGPKRRHQRARKDLVNLSAQGADARENPGRVPALPHTVVMANTRFVFLEIAHPEINSLLWNIQWILADAEPRHQVHLTLRGPYEGEIARDVLDKFRDTLCNDTLRICDVGRFTNAEQEVVFVRVDSQNLRKVWWKRSYPIRDYGYTPHISLYRGHDAMFADRVAHFLQREPLELFCADHRLSVHPYNSLPFGVSRPAAFEEMQWPVGAGRVPASLLPRLRRFVDDYRASSVPTATAPTTGNRGGSLDADHGGTTVRPQS